MAGQYNSIIKFAPLISVTAGRPLLLFLLVATLIQARHLREIFAATPAAADNKIARFLELEREALRHDETTWAGEVQALRFGGKIISLWDQLRRTNAWPVLNSFDFGRLHVSEVGAAQPAGNGIIFREFTGALRSFGTNEWRQRLQEWEKQGYILEQSEWRQVAFSTNAPQRSVFDVELHISHPPSTNRYQAAFQLEILWELQNTAPFPTRLKLLKGRILSRQGPPQFTHWFSMELPLVKGFETLDPFLAVYDLNGDHRPEIALAAPNIMLRPSERRFTPETLCAVTRGTIQSVLFADFDGSGTVDLLGATREGLFLYRGTRRGAFPDAPARAWTPPESLYNPAGISSGDIDQDGDLDVYLTQYKLPYVGGQMPTPFYDANDGFPSYLLLNDGNGAFSNVTIQAGLAPKQHRRVYSSSFLDLDADTDLDLMVVSDFYGIDLYLNDSRGRFSDVTARLVPDPHAFGMSHTIADFDLDGSLDIFMAGMNSDAASRLDSMNLGRPGFPRFTEMRRRMSQGNRLYTRAGPKLRDRAVEMNVAKAGWVWGAVTLDLEDDQDSDLYVVNGHNSRATAMDYETQFWRHDVYAGNSALDPAMETFFQSFGSKLYGAGWSYGGFHKNKLFINQAGTNFLEAAYLFGLAREEDCSNLVAADLDADGDQDLLMVRFQQFPRMRQSLHAYRNDRPSGPWAAVVLHPGAAPGTIVSIGDEPRGMNLQTYVTGDSYRSQRPAMLRFALSSNTPVQAQVRWPNSSRVLSVPLRPGTVSPAAPRIAPD